MVGITSYGAYIPLWRLNREAIAAGLSGEKAVANYDEDSLTMAVGASLDCINGVNRESVDGVFFASTTSPYREKQISTTVAVACDLQQEIITADFANSLKAGTTAMRSAIDAVKAGSARQVLVTAADCRLGAPGSEFEYYLGDGAGALLIGSTDVAASLEASYSVADEITDVWRAEDDRFVQAWEERFVYTEGYLRVVREAVSGLMRKAGLSAKDITKLVLGVPNAGIQAQLARGLGFDPKTQLQAHLADVMGYTGAAYPLMLLVTALEGAKAGDCLLLTGYGNGSDAFIFRVTEQIEKARRGKRGMHRYVASKVVFNDYKTYLQNKGFIKPQPFRRSYRGIVSMSAYWRERDRILRLHGSACRACGTIQYPPQRVCTKCHAQDQSDPYRFSDKRARVYTYTFDSLTSPVDVPLVQTIIDFDEGGRMDVMMTDRVIEEIEVGMPVEMTFRKIFIDGAHNYGWKAMPLRAKTTD